MEKPSAIACCVKAIGRLTLLSLAAMAVAFLPYAAFGQDQKQPLRFLGNRVLPPFIALENGKPRGIVVDLAYALAKKAGLSIAVEAVDWSTAQSEVLDGKADALLQINSDPQREQIYDFSDTLVESRFQIFREATRIDIQSLESLRGKKVGVEPGGFPAQELTGSGELHLVPVPTWKAAFTLLNAGEVDAVIVDRWVGEYELATNRFEGITVVEPPVFQNYSRIAVRKGNKELLDKINAGLQSIKQNGTFQRLLDKWRPTSVEYFTKRYVDSLILYATAVCSAFVVGIAIIAFSHHRIAAARRLLAESEGRLNNLVTILNLGTFLTREVNGTIRFWSDGCTRLLGWASAEVVGRHPQELLRTRYPVPWSEIVATVERTGTWGGDLQVRARDGRELSIEARFAARRNPETNETELLEALTDVTALRQSEQRFKALTIASSEVLYTISPDWTTMRELHGRSLLADITNANADWLAEYIPSGEQARVKAAIHEAIRAKSVFELEHQARLSDGTIGWALSRAVPLLDPEGQIREWFGAASNITARRTAEEALIAGEAELRRLNLDLHGQKEMLQLAMQAALMGAWSWNLATDQLQWDARQFELFGIDPDTGQPTGAAALARVHPDDLPELKAAIGAVVELGGDTFSAEFRVRCPDGVRWLAGYGHAVRDADGHAIRLVGLNFDITARRQAVEALNAREAELESLNLDLEARVEMEVQGREAAQRQLAHAQKMQAIGQLAGGIAHDFNNILQAVQGAAVLIERRITDDATRKLARRALEAAERGSTITGRLLSFSRQSELRGEPLDAAEVLEGVRDILAHTLGGNIDVSATVAPGLASLFADRGQLETALVNLGTNARDAMPDGGELTLSAAADVVQEGKSHPAGLTPGSYIRISVNDTGFGMDAHTLERATEPFFTTKPIGKGTGLGLPMVKGIAEQSGGGMALRSLAGRGTTVSLWLPQATEKAKAERLGEVPAIALREGPARHVLVVDDDELVRETIALNLESNGCLVRSASSGADALALLDQGDQVDALVCDLSMPGMNGIATIRAAQQRRPGLPAVLLTGYTGERAALEAREGTFLLLRKPVHSDQLMRQIETAINAQPAAA